MPPLEGTPEHTQVTNECLSMRPFLASPCLLPQPLGLFSKTALLCQASHPHTCPSLTFHWITSQFQHLTPQALYLR